MLANKIKAKISLLRTTKMKKEITPHQPGVKHKRIVITNFLECEKYDQLFNTKTGSINKKYN